MSALDAQIEAALEAMTAAKRIEIEAFENGRASINHTLAVRAAYRRLNALLDKMDEDKPTRTPFEVIHGGRG